MSNLYPFHSSCGCLQSESTAGLKKDTENVSQEMQLNCSYDQTHLHNLSDADSLKKIFISKESIHVLKLNTLRKRMIITLNGIQSLLNNRPQPDGVEDLKRRQQRATEFSARFCRNYLYQLQRQMNIISKMWKNSSVNHTHSSYFILCQKVITTHQNAHLALQAYLHHMPCSVEKGVPDKLEELLEVVHSLCCICSKLDMSEGDSDCNSERVKQQCEQLMSQIKSGVSVEEKESYVTESHICAQKRSKSHYKKQMPRERYSMYSRNPCHISNTRQNKIIIKPSQAPRNTRIELRCRRHHDNEFTAADFKKTSVTAKPVTHKTYAKVMREDTEIGEVCATDNVTTMMECFLDEEVPEQTEIPSEVPCSKRFTSPVIKGCDEKPVPSVNTLRKLETEITHLKKQTKSLKELGHPNYSVYIKTLETMSRQLSSMKSRKQTVHIPPSIADTTPNICKANPLVNKKPDNEFPKNVKLICLTSANENESSNADEKYFTTFKSSVNTVQKTDRFDQEDKSFSSAFQQENDNRKDGKYENGFVQVQVDRISPRAGKHDRQNQEFVETCLPTFSGRSLGEEIDLSVQVQHPVWTKTCSYGEVKDHDSKHLQREMEPVKLSVSHHDKASAFTYHQMFQNYMSSNSLYNESIKPWCMVTRLANRIIDKILEDVALNDTGIQKITSGLLQLEFQ